ncbi:MAG: UxaA family hydrolase [Mucilaginibacter sp.]
MEKFILLHPQDNVLIVRKSIADGDKLLINGKTIIFEKGIGIGHKVAARDIKQGEQINKYGIPIGSAIESIQEGSHIHLHNMKSDYIPTYTLEKEFDHDK